MYPMVWIKLNVIPKLFDVFFYIVQREELTKIKPHYCKIFSTEGVGVVFFENIDTPRERGDC